MTLTLQQLNQRHHLYKWDTKAHYEAVQAIDAAIEREAELVERNEDGQAHAQQVITELGEVMAERDELRLSVEISEKACSASARHVAELLRRLHALESDGSSCKFNNDCKAKDGK